jgi:Ca2+-binding RTX toxin-like protein
MAIIWTTAQIIEQLTNASPPLWRWTGATVTYRFPIESSGMNALKYEKNGFIPVTASQAVFIKLALQTWDDLIPQSFVQIYNGTSDIEVGYSSSLGEAYAYVISGRGSTAGSTWLSSTVGQDTRNSTTSPTIGYYGFATLIHEVGHALGLNHMGNYNAGSGSIYSPSSYQDTHVFSIMSYFGPDGEPSNEVKQADWIGQSGRIYSPQTPMLNDILAIQSIYGVSTTTRTEDTIYGFNSSISGETAKLYNFSVNTNPILTIFDSDGIDTLDLSGWATPSSISLVAGTFSSCNYMTNNIAIAYNCKIENAFGGKGNDTLIGNEYDNILEGGEGSDTISGGAGRDTIVGGAGNDVLDGGEGQDRADFSGAFSSYTFNYTAATGILTVSNSVTGVDSISRIEFFQFSDIQKSLSQLITSDSIAPTIVSTLPSDNSSGVLPNANLIINFNEYITTGTGNIRIYNDTGVLFSTIAIGDIRQVTISANTLTINPTNDLIPGSRYYINIDSGAVKDLAGNSFLGIVGATSFNFTTSIADTLAPTLLSISPLDNSANISPSSNLVLSFSEEIKAGSGNVVIYSSTGAVVKTISIVDSSQVTISNNTLTINPTSDFLFGTNYYVLIGSGVITDLAGNHFAGISSSTSFNFSTSTTNIIDDYPFSTQTTGSVVVDSAGSIGVIDFSDDADLFKVTLVAGTRYTFNLSSTTSGLADPYLQLYSSSAELLASDDDSGGLNNSQIIFTALNSGTYYLGAMDFGAGTGRYVLTAKTFQNVSDDFTDSTNTTGIITIGSQTTGNIEVSTDKDWFKVALNAGVTYRFELLGFDAGGGTLGSSSGQQPYLSLYDANGVYIRATANGGTGGDPLLTFTAPTTGYFFLSAQDLYGTGTGTYTLKATSAGVIADDFSNSISTSGRITVGGQSRGSIDNSYDEDWFKVELIAGTTYQFDLSGAKSLGGTLGSGISQQPYLSLFDSSGRYITASASGGVSADPRITFTPTSTGSYFLSAQELYGPGLGTYTLKAVSKGLIVDDYANNTTTSGVLKVEGQTLGNIEITSDVDWFSISLIAGQRYVFNLDSASSNGLADPYLSLFSVSGTLLMSDDDSGPGRNSQLYFIPTTSGIFYLSASDFYGTSSGAYKISAATVVDDFPWSTATTGVVIINGAAVNGVINFESDQDLFKVNLVAGTTYIFDLVGASSGLSDPLLRLYSSDVVQLSSDDDSGDLLNSRIIYTAPTTGTYYLGAEAALSGTGAYKISAATVVDDFPWSTATTGVVIINGAAVNGVINFESDQDLFKVNLVAGTTYIFDLVGASSGLSDPLLRLYSPDVVQLSSDDDSGDLLNSRIIYTATTTGTYYLGAEAALSGTGAYKISASRSDVDLTPYLPNGWSDKIIVSTDFGNNTDSSIYYTDQTLYIDWASINNGKSDVTNTFYTNLYVDGTFIQRWSTSSLAAGNYAFVSDYSLGFLSAGSHTIKIVTDANSEILEANETNNEYTKTITVITRPSTDITPPTVAITGTTNWLGISYLITFTLSEASSNFTLADISVTGGSLSNFSGSGAVYTATFLPTDTNTAKGVIKVPSGVFSDAAGNLNQDGNDANNTFTITYITDVTPPTIALSTNSQSLGQGEVATITFTLSESTTNFTASDVTVSGGMLSNFSGSGTTYTALFTPNINSKTNGVVSVSSGMFTDAAGNANSDGSDANNTIILVVNTVPIGKNYIGTNGNDNFVGDIGNDTISGGAGNDTLYGGKGNDYIDGGTGIDRIIYGEGEDTVYGGAGNDEINGYPDSSGVYSYFYWDTSGSKLVYGEDGNDLIVGSSSSDTLDGGLGNDTIYGHNGDDFLSGGNGEDKLYKYNYSGNSTLNGGAGNDTIQGGLGNDSIDGGDGDDSWLEGYEGNDAIFGGNGSDKLYGDEGNDTLDGGAGNDTIYGGTGNDSLVGGLGDDKLYDQTDGQDTLLGGDGNDYLYTYSGTSNKYLDGGIGADSLYGGNGADTLIGGEDDDYIYGDIGSDSIAGGNGADKLYGHGGNDTLEGGSGNDTIYGGSDNDFLIGGLDADSLYGGIGSDTLISGDGDDILYGENGSDSLFGGAGNDKLFEYGSDGQDTLLGGDGNDTLNATTGTGNKFLDGGNGDDSLYGGNGNDTLIGGEGIDILSGDIGNDSLDGGKGNDIIQGGSGNDTLDGGVGNDSLYGELGNDLLVGGLGNDLLWERFDGQDTLLGGDGNDNLNATTGTGNKILDGGTGSDTLAGGNGNDTLIGGDGDDIVTGDIGSDALDGGEGTDSASWTRASSNYQLTSTATGWKVTDKTGTDGIDTVTNIEKLQFTDRAVIIESKAHASYSDIPTELYQFFITAFNAAPGVTYMDQLAEAYRYGLSVKQIVDIFTTKKQFTDVYSTSLNNLELATLLVNNIVKNSVDANTKAEGIMDIKEALDYGLTRGDVIYNVFGNLAKLPLVDPIWNAKWGNTAKQFANEIAVAKYYTEVLNQSTTDLETLRDAIQPVTQSTDVSSDVVIAQLVGVALMSGGLGPGP